MTASDLATAWAHAATLAAMPGAPYHWLEQALWASTCQVAGAASAADAPACMAILDSWAELRRQWPATFELHAPSCHALLSAALTPALASLRGPELSRLAHRLAELAEGGEALAMELLVQPLASELQRRKVMVGRRGCRVVRLQL